MLVASGSLDKIGNPCLKVRIAGVYSKGASEFDAIIDTGFSGFISMPLVQAFPLGLPLHGTTTVTLADGQDQVKLLAGAKVSVGNKTKEEFGLVILEETSTDILIGMDFLRTFKLALFASQSAIGVLDEDALGQMMKDAAAAKATTEGVSPSSTEPSPPSEPSPSSA